MQEKAAPSAVPSAAAGSSQPGPSSQLGPSKGVLGRHACPHSALVHDQTGWPECQTCVCGCTGLQVGKRQVITEDSSDDSDDDVPLAQRKNALPPVQVLH